MNWHAVGADAPALQDIRKLLVAKGLSSASASDVGESIYNRGVYNGVLIAEAIRTAQQLTGKKLVTGEDVRRGFESLKITAERWKEIGLPDYAAPVVNLSCDEHSGHHASYVQQWDGEKWEKVSGWFQPMTSVVRPLLETAAKEYAEKNVGWPKRTEPCEKAP